MADVGIFIPLMRPHRIRLALESIRNSTRVDYRVYWMVDARATEAISILNEEGQTYFLDDGGTWGKRLNYMYEHTTEPHFFLGADDLIWHDGWYEVAMRYMNEVDGVVSVNDLQSQGDGTSPLVSRNYIDTRSGCADTPRVVIYPGYKHNFSERELYVTAQQRNCFRYARDAIVEHIHFLSGKAPHDEVYAKGDATYLEDEALFQSRHHIYLRG
jgi:hypothetical protein